ncbi:Protein archease [uncultured archaeon]|nr:Protein archease [uncultured archaeon]
MPYKYIEGLTSADVAFEAIGKTIEEMFESAGVAVLGTMVRDPNNIKQKTKRTIEKSAPTIEKLLFDFLDELIFLKDAEQMFFSGFKAKISGEEGDYSLKVEAKGEKIDAKRHDIAIDAKAVTMHKFEVKQTPGGWRAQVIIDV